MMPRLLAILLLIALGGTASARDWPGDSLYRLELPLRTQDDGAVRLDHYGGQPVLITLFYTRCQYTCPLLVRSLQQLDQQLDAATRAQLRVLLVSLDPEHDTAEALRSVARKHQVDLTRWTLARTDAANVRKLAAALDIPYRALDDGEFSHATVITLLDRDGRITARTANPLKPEPEFKAALRAR